MFRDFEWDSSASQVNFLSAYPATVCKYKEIFFYLDTWFTLCSIADLKWEKENANIWYQTTLANARIVQFTLTPTAQQIKRFQSSFCYAKSRNDVMILSTYFYDFCNFSFRCLSFTVRLFSDVFFANFLFFREFVCGSSAQRLFRRLSRDEESTASFCRRNVCQLASQLRLKCLCEESLRITTNQTAWIIIN